jgi:DNA-binding MarR family transcriptional regulator
VRLQIVPGIHRATHRIALHLDAAQPPLDVSQGEAHLLAFLAEAGPSAIAQLHDAFAHKRSTLTSYLDRLEEKGLALRQLHPGDRRSYLIALTPAGKKRAARIHQRLAELEEGAFARLGERDLRGFQAVLHALQEQATAKKGRKR